VSPPVAGFEGGEGSAVEAGPPGGSGNALKVLRSGGQVFALAIVTLPSNIPLEAGRLTISARVYSPTAGIPMVLKLEGPGGNPSSGDLQANETVVVGWQTLTWTVPAVNTNFNTIVLLPNLGTVDAPPGKAYYFDNITLLGAASGGASGTLLANFDTVSPPIAGFEGGEGSAIEAGPTGGSGNALKVLRSGGQVFALAIVTLPSNIPLEATRKTISARVYSPTAGIPMVLKLEGPGGNPSSGDVQANETVVVGWQTLTWTINAVNTNYNVIVLLPNLGTVDAPPGKAYYFDDITLLGAGSGVVAAAAVRCRSRRASRPATSRSRAASSAASAAATRTTLIAPAAPLGAAVVATSPLRSRQPTRLSSTTTRRLRRRPTSTWASSCLHPASPAA
jgi:hypothetical protein